MQELEKILEEIKAHRNFASECGNFNVASAFELCVEIIRKHMNDGWISVEDGLPEDGKSVLCCSDDERMMIGVLHKEYYVDFGIAVAENYNQIMNDVIAWQPLPEPYRPEGSDGECGAGDENNGGCAWRLKMQNRETRCRN